MQHILQLSETKRLVMLLAVVLCFTATKAIANHNYNEAPSEKILESDKKNLENEFNVTGRVFDSVNDENLPGVNIIVKGTTIGTSSDINGEFQIRVPSEQDTLVFSYIGYNTLEIPIEGRDQIEVELEPRQLTGQEVIVVGYGTMDRRDMTGSVSQISSRDMTQVSVANPTELLSGRVPGLMTRSNTGLPGAGGADLRIRGFSNPLVLVDGIEMSFANIDPNDIESVSVLKDASAAVYGARAGNGVILVTTKRGESGTPRVRIRSDLSFQQPTELITPVNAAQHQELFREGQINSGINPTVSEQEIENYRMGEPGFESYDWYDATFRDWAPMQTHNLSVAGGVDDVRYFLSVGHLNQESAFRSGDFNFKRYNVRTNLDADVSSRLSAYVNLSARVERTDRTSESLQEIFGGLMRSQPMQNPQLPDGRAAYSGFGNISPVAQSNSSFNGLTEIDQDRLEGAIGSKYQVPGIDGLEAEVRLNFRYTAYSRWVSNRQFEIFEYVEEIDDYISRGARGSSNVRRDEFRDQWINPLVSLRYEGTFGSHRLSGLAVAEYIDSNRRGFEASRLNPISPDVPFLFAGSIDGIDNSDFWTESARASYIGRVRYGYRDRYRIESTIRADATHKFAPGSRWGFFPSVSASWSLSNEPFFNVDFVDELRFRASYSQTGQDAGVAAFRYQSEYFIRNLNFMFGDDVLTLIREEGLPNPDVTWLEMTNFNVGINATVLNEMLEAEFNVFKRKTDNIFGTALGDIPSTFGAILPPLNINAREDNGYEVELTHRNSIRNFRYSIAGNLSHSREQYVRWAEPDFDDPDEARLFQRQGNYVNRFIGYKSDGMFMSQEEINNHQIDQDGQGNATLRPGDIRYVDLNGDGQITFRDQTDIGRGPFPDMSFGLDIDLNYRGFGISALFQGASKFNLDIVGRSRGAFDNEGVPHLYQYKYRWQPDPADPAVNINPDAQLPAIENPGLGANVNNSLTSDFWLKDGTYLRLKNLNISYAIPAQYIQRVGLHSLRFYVSGSNLYTWDRLGIFSGSFDPEIPQTVRGAYPTLRTVSVGFNMEI